FEPVEPFRATADEPQQQEPCSQAKPLVRSLRSAHRIAGARHGSQGAVWSFRSRVGAARAQTADPDHACRPCRLYILPLTRANTRAPRRRRQLTRRRGCPERVSSGGAARSMAQALPRHRQPPVRTRRTS
ncbi:MAG: hypothetical protein ACK559_06640, partial [bacterium]